MVNQMNIVAELVKVEPHVYLNFTFFIHLVLIIGVLVIPGMENGMNIVV
jgi:ABC-type polysaccharide/polyol phosphate export permease